jgi:hypothetical protein
MGEEQSQPAPQLDCSIRIADGTRWSAIGPAGKISGLSTSVRALATDGSNIFAGGTFTLAGQTNALHIGRYNGTNWHTFGTGLNDDVKQLALVGTNLYAAGDFSGGAGGPFAGKLARWRKSWKMAREASGCAKSMPINANAVPASVGVEVTRLILIRLETPHVVSYEKANMTHRPCQLSLHNFSFPFSMISVFSVSIFPVAPMSVKPAGKVPCADDPNQ